MKSTPTQVFLSCSFDPKDREVVDFFASICRGIDMQCINVDKGYALTPPEMALELIDDSRALIAVATRRGEDKSGVFTMPKSMEQEISMAFAKKKPILIFAEDGVDTDSGFTSNYCTYCEFDRDMLYHPTFLEKAIASIHNHKVGILKPHEFQIAQYCQENTYAEFTRSAIDLIYQSGSFLWRYSTTRRFRFIGRFTDPIQMGAWSDVQSKGCKQSDLIKWSYSIDHKTKPFIFKEIVEKDTNEHCEVSLEIDPKPEANDIIEISTIFESPFLNPVYLDDIQNASYPVTINGIKYPCLEGVVPIVRTQDMKVQFRFPSVLGLKPSDFVPLVGSYTNKVDYLVDTEMERINIVTDTFGGNVFIEISVQSPLLKHIYGIAWVPPKRP